MQSKGGHIGVYDDYERWLCGIHWSGKSILEGGRGVVVAWLVLCGSDNLSFLLGCMFNESNTFFHILQRHGFGACGFLKVVVVMVAVVPWGRACSRVHIKASSAMFLSLFLILHDLTVCVKKGGSTVHGACFSSKSAQHQRMVLALVCR